MEESSSAHRAIVARRGSTAGDNSVERMLFEKYKNESGQLDVDKFGKLWKEMGVQSGEEFSEEQVEKWERRSMKRLANYDDFEGEEGVSFELFKTMTAEGPLFEVVTKRM